MIQISQTTGDLVAHFFYTYLDKPPLEASHMFESYIKQILDHLRIIRKPCPPDIVASIKQFYGPKQSRPSLDEIIYDMFIPLAKLVPSATYITDGLDECESKEGQKVITILRKILQQMPHGPRILISGRDGLHVTDSIPGSIRIQIPERNAREDIQKVIEWSMAEKMWERRLTEEECVLQDIKNKLNEHADRM